MGRGRGEKKEETRKEATEAQMKQHGVKERLNTHKTEREGERKRSRKIEYKSYLAKCLNAAEWGLMQSGTRKLLAHFSRMVL